jgi:hypothetical protein
MTQNNIHHSDAGNGAWKNNERLLFRFLFVYFFVHVVPLDWKYYRDIFSLDWSSAHFSNLFYIAHYAPRFFGDIPVLQDWVIVALVAIVIAGLWTAIDRQSRNYHVLYYWLRVALRYRLAAALLAYAFLKVFPMQMPVPSLSNLNTHYGDIADWKVFSLSTGIVPGYESFLGLVELTAALLLLFRKTASIGAFIIIPFTGNVVMSNLAYGGGEFAYSLLLVSFAIFILAYDVPRLIALTSFEKVTRPPAFRLLFTNDNLRNARIIVKSVFVFVFVFFYGYQTYAAYSADPYQYPNSKGLSHARGVYAVTEFTINNKELPNTLTDPIRWKDVVFEKWATLSIRSLAPLRPVNTSIEEIFSESNDRTYEFSGIGGRHFYSYTIDSVSRTLTLKNRNENHAQDQYILHYDRPHNDRIVLTGLNASSDSIHVVLDRVEKKYLLEEAARQGRRRGLKL